MKICNVRFHFLAQKRGDMLHQEPYSKTSRVLTKIVEI